MHKIVFEFGALKLHWYGVLLACGFLAGLWTASRRGLLAGMLPEKVADAAPWLIIGSIAGARLWYVVSYWRLDFAGKPLVNIFKVWEGGLVYYGGLVGASLGCILFARFNRLPLWRLADVLAPSVALGQMFGRLGCLMNGCCFGRASTQPWAVKFPVGHPTHPGLVHPTQVYESLLSLGLYLTLAWGFRRRRFDGQIFAGYLLGYAVVRSTVEMFRGDYPPSYYQGGWWTPAHTVSAAIFLTGLGLYLWQQQAGKLPGTPGTTTTTTATTPGNPPPPAS